MTSKQQTHLKMFIATLLVVDKFKQLWSAIVAFANARDAFADAIDNIRAQDNEAIDRHHRCHGQQAEVTRRNVPRHGDGRRGPAAYADTQQDNELFVLADYTMADLTYMPEEDLPE